MPHDPQDLPLIQEELVLTLERLFPNKLDATKEVSDVNHVNFLIGQQSIIRYLRTNYEAQMADR